jgi:alpha-amylase
MLLVAADCSTFNGENGCIGQQTAQFTGWNSRRWQTPPTSDPAWIPSFQSYRNLVGYAVISYSLDRTSATVTVQTLTRDPAAKLVYQFGPSAKFQPANSAKFFAASDHGPLVITVQCPSSGDVLVLEDVDFIWDAAALPAPVASAPTKSAIVEMFGWPYDDLAAECEMIGKAGYTGVKVFPPQESILSDVWLQNGVLNPWYFMYQPVSYRLSGRSGSRAQLRSMIQTCRKFGVRVYADAVMNHMTGGGNDIQQHHNPSGSACVTWGAKNSTDYSPYFTQDFNFNNSVYTAQHPALEYPAVPYGPEDFHCERSLSSWSDPFILNFGWLVGLSDLATEKPSVQQRLAAYLTDLLSIGFSGIRIDAAKHMHPNDIAAILAQLKANMGGSLPADFFAYLEVLVGGEKDLLLCDRASSYSYSYVLTSALQAHGLSAAEINQIFVWGSWVNKEDNFCEDGTNAVPDNRLAVQNDDQDQQVGGSSSRDMGDTGSVLNVDKDVNKHRSFEVSLFTRQDWSAPGMFPVRLVLSTVTWGVNGAVGIPDGLSSCSLCKGQCQGCQTVEYSQAHRADLCGYTVYDSQGKWIPGTYTRVHRDRSIILAMRQFLGLSTSVSNAQIGLPDSCQ